MPPKQSLLALVAALFVIIAASMDTFSNAISPTTMSTSASATPSTLSDKAMLTFTTSTLSTAIATSANATSANATTPPALSENEDSPYILCKINLYNGVDPQYFDSVANHLKGLTGNATLGHKDGEAWCWRYSCQHSCAIYGCNDKQEDQQVPWSTMAVYAEQIKKKCTYIWSDKGKEKKRVQGQAFNADGWNVIVGMRRENNC
ncbi:hypothetical protein N8I77_006270 [Diaporthe amygdali]|uniref:Uncharacterized protein n=1 Tax=Phomopsis amygdali TaxID=1214568 RepID=A0AAD9SGM9_PHOAM|nr:hypothetical protein N8I77_006270 [Diaporthe amygdali]